MMKDNDAMNGRKPFADLEHIVKFAVCLALAGLVGVIDVYTGDYVITIVYVFPVYVSAKLLSRRFCQFFTALSVLILMGASYITHREQIVFSDIYFWNALLQAVLLAITGFLISQFTNRLSARNTKSDG